MSNPTAMPMPPRAGMASPVKVQQYEPGGLGRRWVACLIDGAASYILQMPFTFLIALGFGMKATLVLDVKNNQSIAAQIVSFAMSITVMFLYYGWFNQNKGATPGKLLMGLRVANAEDGTRIGYVRSFCREISKIFSFGLLFIGVFIAVFRKDKRALHDLMCGTKILRLKE